MPYILMKRDDIAEGLQVLDLKPNTSQRRFPYLNPGQTKYVNPVARATPRIIDTAGVFTFAADTSGLEAWLLTNVNDGTGAASTGTVTVAAAAALDTFTITTTPSFVLTAVNAARTPGALDFEDVASSGSNVATAASIVAAIMDDTNWTAAGVTRPVSAANGGTAIVTVTALADGVAGDYVLASSDGGRLAVAGMAGGADANALTAAVAVTDADSITALYAFGDNASAAGVMDLAAINGVLASGAITAAQLPSLFDILSGGAYTVPAGTEIEAASAFAVVPAIGADDGPSYGAVRNTYETGAFRISASLGMLSGYLRADFNFAGVEAAALAVYNDDGTLYVP